MTSVDCSELLPNELFNKYDLDSYFLDKDYNVIASMNSNVITHKFENDSSKLILAGESPAVIAAKPKGWVQTWMPKG